MVGVKAGKRAEEAANGGAYFCNSLLTHAAECLKEEDDNLPGDSQTLLQHSDSIGQSAIVKAMFLCSCFFAVVHSPASAGLESFLSPYVTAESGGLSHDQTTRPETKMRQSDICHKGKLSLSLTSYS